MYLWNVYDSGLYIKNTACTMYMNKFSNSALGMNLHVCLAAADLPEQKTAFKDARY